MTIKIIYVEVTWCKIRLSEVSHFQELSHENEELLDCVKKLESENENLKQLILHNEQVHSDGIQVRSYGDKM